MTLPEIRILTEGKKRLNDDKKRKQKAQQKTGSYESNRVSDTRMDIERAHDKGDKNLVESLGT